MKIITSTLLGFMIVLLLTAGPIYAEEKIKVSVNDQILKLDENPVMMGGRTLVPLREIFESLGAIIEWKSETKTVIGTKGNTTIVLTVGDQLAKVNNQKVFLEVPGIIKNGRTFVPVRFIGESLGAQVGWSEENQTAIIQNSEEESLTLNNVKAIEDSGYDEETYNYLYDGIVEGIKGFKTEIPIDKPIKYRPGMNIIFSNVFNGYGEINYAQGVQYKIRTDSQYITKMMFQYEYSIDTVKAMKGATDKKAQEIIDGIITEDMTDYEKELAIHDYIVNNTRYDSKNKAIPYESHSAYGVLIKGVGVCDGYAKAMKILLNRAGIDAILISGTANGEEHQWNIVKIDNQLYHVDAIFDDPISSTGENILSYNYFNIPDKEISFDHEWNKESYPACSTLNNRYYKSGLGTFEEVGNYEELYELLDKRIKEKQQYLFIKTTSNNKEEYDLEKLISEIINTRPTSILSTYSYFEYIGGIKIELKYKK